MTAGWKLKTIELDWDQVSIDLNKWRSDQTMTRCIVDNTVPWFSCHDNLQQYQSVYAKYGYTCHNTGIWKNTNVDPGIRFDWESALLAQLPLDRGVVTLTRQDPGQILPWHMDRFFMLRRLHPADTRMIARVLLFVEDWKMGHLLQIHRDMCTHWQQGDLWIWPPGTYHLSANVGLEPKWTCNITGFVNDAVLAQQLALGQ